ncbi:putative transcription factor WD40-like family [Helianthus anomalus]
MVVSADKLFTPHQDHKIRVWKTNTQQNKLAHLATLPTLGDRALKILIPKHKKSTWVHHLDTVSALALSNDGSLLYSVSWDKTLKIWQTADFKCLESVASAHDDSINALVLSSNGEVYTGSTDRKIKIWRKTSEGEDHILVATLEKHKSGVNALALSVDENTLYSGGSDRWIVVWEKNMVAVDALKPGAHGSADETIRIWRGIEKCYFCLAILEGHRGPVKCLTLVKDTDEPSDTSYLIYSGGLDCDIKVWHLPYLI